ncbi:MAG: class I SAM-dependent methyltransferase [Candidatus Eremiobacteraeota bacterium]|nr:class I SAM-dependent methyltransferase [Candidatus Eremiobacteraeota bacterium]
MITAGQIAAASRGHFNLENLDRAALARLREILAGSGYCEENIYKALGIDYFNMITLQMLPVFLDFRLKDRSPFNAVAKLFLLSQALPGEEVLEALFTSEEVASLTSMGILTSERDLISSNVDIYPVMGSFIVTDHHFSNLKFGRSVMYLSKDSYTLARGTPRKAAGKTLDLCTGSGVQAILAASHSEHVTGVDINPRAINFAEFNKVFNAVENVDFIEGDLFGPLGEEKYDLIVANPPFVPAPAGRQKVFFRDGGVTGEEVLKRIMGGIDRYLADEGKCVIFTEFVQSSECSYVEKVARWAGSNFDILALQGNTVPIELYVIGHLKHDNTFAEYRRKMGEWLVSAYNNAITSIAEGLIVCARPYEGCPSVHRLAKVIMPNRPFPEEVEGLIETLRRSGQGDAILSYIPCINSHVRFLWKGRTPEGQEVHLAQFKEESLLKEEELTKEEADLLCRMDGRRTLKEVARSAIQEGAPKTSMEDFLTRVKSLAQKHVIALKNPSSELMGSIEATFLLLLIDQPVLQELLDSAGQIAMNFPM